MKPAAALTLICLSVFFVSCAGPSFEKEWKVVNSAYSEKLGKEEPIVGPWTGSWLTPGNGHTGDLRCIIAPTEEPGRYAFRYHATWAKFFSGGYRAEFDVVPSGEGYTVEGTKDLGMFGEFSHEGTILGDAFNSTFEASGYEGHFNLKRP